MNELRDMLRSLEVKAKLFSTLAQVDLIQTFQNDSKDSVELSYLFPVPPKAQVIKFVAKIGEKTIQSQIEETEKAYQEYDQAIGKGDTAAIVERLRKDVLELSFGNVLPSETAVVTLSYLQELSFTEESTDLTWRIPLVVAPRYDSSPTPESERIQPVIGKNTTSLQIEAIIQPSNPIKSISSPSHPIEVMNEKEQTIVHLSKTNKKPDSDFVLHIKLDAAPMNHLYTEQDAEKGYFSLLQITPEIPAISGTEEPKSVGFLLDISGSMDGEKILQAKQALKLCLRQLNIRDSFNVVAFSSQYYCFQNSFIPYNDDSMKKADKWIDEVHESGGTEIFAPLSTLLSMMNPEKPGIILLFTDGQVSDEEKIIRLVEEHAHHIQLFSFGIDTAVNESFIDGIAKAGNGLPEYIVPGERIEDKVLRQLDRMNTPFWDLPECFTETGESLEVVPPLPKKMFANETYHHLFHQASSEKVTKITLRAAVHQKKVTITFKPEKSRIQGSIRSWWALEKIRTMEKNLYSISPRRKTTQQKAIVEISKQYSVLSAFTALIAVMTRETKVKGMPKWVRIPVCVPKGWEMQHSMIRGAMPDAMPPAMPMKNQFTQVSDSRNYFAKMPIEFLSMNIASPESPVESSLRLVALAQHADGSIGSPKNRIQQTSLFIIGMLLSGINWQGYKGALKKAAAFLIKQPVQEPFYQACTLTLIQKHAILVDASLENHLEKCIQQMSTEEKEIFERFQTDSLITFVKYLKPTVSVRSSHQKMIQVLLDKLIP